MKKLTLTLLSLFVIYHSYGQKQITDFTYKGNDKSSSPRNFVKFNNLLFFEAITESFGSEIWVSNGSENGATLLKDIYSGKTSGIASPLNKSSVVMNNSLYFIARDELSKGEIWKTDGTTAGTEKVTHFINQNILQLTLVGDKFYFLIQVSNKLQVWISDGTESGTTLVLGDIPIWNVSTFQGKINNTFIFTFQANGSNASKVWRSDGTSSGTFPITNDLDGCGAGSMGSSGLTQYVEYKNNLYFVVRSSSIFTGSNNVGILKTDGTLANTLPVKAVHNGLIPSVNYADVIEINSKLYFSFYEVGNKRLFIWESDGTDAGTTKIYDKVNDRYFMTSNLARIGTNLVFCGANVSGGTSLIKMNLVDYTTVDIKELQATTTAPFNFVQENHMCNLKNISNDRFFISVPIGSSKTQGWISNLTETVNVSILDNISGIFVNGDSFYFSSSTSDIGAELWKSDGSESGTLLLDNINKTRVGIEAFTNDLSGLNGELIFNAYNNAIGDEIWKYSTINGLTMVKDIQPGTGPSFPDNFITFNGNVYFVADDGIHGFELWKTNGTADGTVLVMDLVLGAESSYNNNFTEHKGNLYFTIYKDSHYFLCKTDGAATEIVKDFGLNEFGSINSVGQMVSSGDYLYVSVMGAGTDLWISNGTEIGTSKVKDFYGCKNLINVNGKLFFTAIEVTKTESELWTSDGTSIGTNLVKDIGIGYSSAPSELISFNNLLFFTASTSENGKEIWRSNGTLDGTFLVTDIYPGVQSSIVTANFSISNNYLFFNANNGVKGFELWKTNGLESGTVLVKDINVGEESGSPSQMVGIKDLLYFTAYDRDHGVELWKTDGSEAGTTLVADIMSGIQSSTPTNIFAIAEDIYFIAEAPNDGRQIWKIKYNALAAIYPTLPDLMGECSITAVSPTISDDFVGTVTGTTTDPLTYGDQGSHIIHWTFDDGSINSILVNQNVIIADVTYPVLQCISDQIRNLSVGESEYTISGIEFDPTEINDNCGVKNVVNSLNSSATLIGAKLPVGLTKIEWKGTDAAGNETIKSFNVQVNTFVGIGDLEANGITIFPNPTTGSVHLNFTHNNILQITISDMTGKVLIDKSASQHDEIIDLSKYPNGIYLVAIRTDKQTILSKLVKK